MQRQGRQNAVNVKSFRHFLSRTKYLNLLDKNLLKRLTHAMTTKMHIRRIATILAAATRRFFCAANIRLENDDPADIPFKTKEKFICKTSSPQ